jgi:hypothetical protein
MNPEISLPSREGVRRREFHRLGLTDSMLLELCAADRGDVVFSLLTADGDLALEAEMLGYGVLNFSHLR